jgi:hypothetical protein
LWWAKCQWDGFFS